MGGGVSLRRAARVVKLSPAGAEDAAELGALHRAVSEDLTARYGQGPWSTGPSERAVLFHMRRGNVYVARSRGRVIAALTLSKRKPWAIDVKYFTAVERPLYLTGMAVTPGRQRRGVGRMCLDEARKIAKKWPGDAIRLDAFDAEAGAGEFYSKCGFREVGRTVYRVAPLIYFELVL